MECAYIVLKPELHNFAKTNSESEATRKKFQRAFAVIAGWSGIVLIWAWVSYNITNFTHEIGVGYQGALAALAGMIPAYIGNVKSIVSYMRARYNPNKKYEFNATVDFLAWYPVMLLLASIVVIVVSAIFGIHFEDRVDGEHLDKKDKNVAIGINNVVLGCFANILATVAIYYGRLLKKEVERAKNNEGAFAPE